MERLGDLSFRNLDCLSKRARFERIGTVVSAETLSVSVNESRIKRLERILHISGEGSEFPQYIFCPRQFLDLVVAPKSF